MTIQFMSDTRTRPPLPLASSAGDPYTDAQPRRILVVDDDEQMLGLVRRILGRYGYLVTTATNAIQALGACERCQQAFDLIIMDLVMPHIDGLEAYQRIHTLHPDWPVLFISASMPNAVNRQLAAQALPFLAKPFTPQTLAQVVEALI